MIKRGPITHKSITKKSVIKYYKNGDRKVSPRKKKVKAK